MGTFAPPWHGGLFLVCYKLRILLTQGHYLLQEIKVITLKMTVVVYVPCCLRTLLHFYDWQFMNIQWCARIELIMCHSVNNNSTYCPVALEQILNKVNTKVHFVMVISGTAKLGVLMENLEIKVLQDHLTTCKCPEPSFSTKSFRRVRWRTIYIIHCIHLAEAFIQRDLQVRWD